MKRRKPTSKQVSRVKRERLPAVVPQPGEPWMVAAIRAGLTADQIRELRIEYEAQRAYEARLAFDAAWTKAQAELPIILRSKEVDFTGKKEGSARVNYWYAPFDEVVDAVRPILAKYGLAYSQSISNNDTHVTVKTVLMGFGHREEPGSTNMLAKDAGAGKNDAQAMRSSQTYAQRYTLLGALGLATSDDTDGRTNSNGNVEPTVTPEQAEALRVMLDEIAKKDPAYEAIVFNWCRNNSKGAKIETVDDVWATQFEYVHGQILRKKAKLAQTA